MFEQFRLQPPHPIRGACGCPATGKFYERIELSLLTTAKQK
jgi:hypothetical protein